MTLSATRAARHDLAEVRVLVSVMLRPCSSDRAYTIHVTPACEVGRHDSGCRKQAEIHASQHINGRQGLRGNGSRYLRIKIY
jgi:hypothetical protein